MFDKVFWCWIISCLAGMLAIKFVDVVFVPYIVGILSFAACQIISRPTKRAPDVCHSCGAKEHYTEKVCSVCGARR